MTESPEVDGLAMGEPNATREAAQGVSSALIVVKRGAGYDLPLIDGDGSAVAIVWPGMGARFRTMHHFRLDAKARTVAQQHDSEAVYAVLDGDVTITALAEGKSASLSVGAMVYIDPDTVYRFTASEYGAIIVGGPCPPDSHLYAD